MKHTLTPILTEGSGTDYRPTHEEPQYRGLFRDSFGCFDNRSCSNTKVIDELIRLPAVWDRANGELVYFDSFGSYRAQHGIPETTVRIMVLNGKDVSLCGPGAIQ